MSDGKRNKKYSKTKETKRPVILTKRDAPTKNDKHSNKASEEKIQPKILLKAKEKNPAPPPISIVTREQTDSSVSQSPSVVNVQCKEKDNAHIVTAIEQPIQPVPRMTRPVAFTSSSHYQGNPNNCKLFMKTNTDFFVIGVIGAQGVGKTTIMNLLASNDNRSDPYNYFFKQKDGIFPVKSKNGKSSCNPHTESIQMFITKDRMILLDCPPVLSNSYRKDANELDDLKMIIILLTACHLVIVVQDDYFDLSLMRLLQFAELAKPNHDMKPFVNDYLPNILFVKNNGKRNDFLQEEKQRIESMLKFIFKNSQLKIFIGQNEKHKRAKLGDHEKYINYLVFPEIKSDYSVAYHSKLDVLVMELRNRVFMTPRNQMYNGNTELTEALWFELIVETTTNKDNFFLTIYEEIRRIHTQSQTSQM